MPSKLNHKSKKIIALLGATGIGKSKLAIELAKKIDAEIISCDSMQIYKKLTIGTGKILPQEMQNIPHHLIDLFDISQAYNANIFCSLAEECVKKIHKKGKKVILVGGSGLYARIFLYKEKMLPSNKNLYQKLWKEYKSQGINPLWEKLKEKDPETAKKFPNNPRRIIRMLEATLLLEKPLPKQEFLSVLRDDALEIVLSANSNFNREKIVSRCKQMLMNGWIEETQTLAKQGLFQTPTASQALGYNIIYQETQKPQFDKEELLKKLVVSTHRYAKKQRTWFKNKHPNANFLSIDNKDIYKSIDYILKKLSSHL